MVNLAGPGDGDAADCLTEGEKVGPAKDIDAFVGGVTAQDILEGPRSFYVNVHNKQYPDGAVRGQLLVSCGGGSGGGSGGGESATTAAPTAAAGSVREDQPSGEI